jgi:hypothetical protein
MSPVVDLPSFLLARYDEDEAAVGGTPSPWQRDVLEVINPKNGAVVASNCNGDDADHIAHWDPAFVLADIESKRRIVAKCQYFMSDASQPERRDLSRWDAVLLDLAAPFSGHPDYQEAWNV